MDYRIKNNKYIFNKEGVYFSLTIEQVVVMRKTLQKIEKIAFMECNECGDKNNLHDFNGDILCEECADCAGLI